MGGCTPFPQGAVAIYTQMLYEKNKNIHELYNKYILQN